ncbi:MAG: DUF4093 domain-containing protein [Clostridia bacterium]|nr:DUF4093 domain-containing protein [Clostridia bacterium]
MYSIKEAIIVEGTYDQIKLSGFIDGIIIKTNGFSIFNDKKKLETIKTLAEKTGIVILTDSDTAGFKIRNYIKQYIPEEMVKHAYVPDIRGKEKRKNRASKEGLLGVEGINESVIIKALKDSGCEINGISEQKEKSREITKTDLYLLGLSGGEDSSKKRIQLCSELGIPAKISSNMLTAVLNRLFDYEQLYEYFNDSENKLDENSHV